MRHFQLLMIALLAVIAFELGLISIKLPTPVVQAQLAAPVGPPQQNVSQVMNEHDNRVIALVAKVDALTSKVDSQFANLPTKMHDELVGITHQVINVKDMLRKHMGCQYPQCYQ